MFETFKIGVVAKRTGLTVDAIRFYEREGLLEVPLRSEGGFRLYQEKHIQDLGLIRSGHSIGFSLDEIRDLLSFRNGVSAPCAEVKRLLEQKLVAVRRKLAELMRMERDMTAAFKECKRALRASRVD